MVIWDQYETGDIGDMSKDSFIVYTSYEKNFSLLNMEQRGVLITAMMSYQLGNDLPEMDALTEMAFSFIRDDMDRNNQSYEEKCNKNRENGKKGGRPKTEKANGFSENPEKANGYFENPNDNDNESDNDNDSKETKQRKFVKPSVDEVRQYCQERQNNVDPETFVDFYESKGWKVGSNAMKDWKSAVRTWEKRSDKPVSNKSSPQKNKSFDDMSVEKYNKIHNFSNERKADYSEWDFLLGGDNG